VNADAGKTAKGRQLVLHPLVASHPWALLDFGAVHPVTVVHVHFGGTSPPLACHVWRGVDASGVGTCTLLLNHGMGVG